MTYRELDESASRLAHHLAAAGVGPETVTGVHLERGVDLIAAILAIMKAGGGYGPRATLAHRRAARLAYPVARPGLGPQHRGSPFLRSLGAAPIARERYLTLLERPAEPIPLPARSLPADRLLPAWP